MNWTELIEVLPSPGKGVGLFAKVDLETHTHLCSAPISYLPLGSLDGTPLEEHVCEVDGKNVITWGPQTLINHSDEPNCECLGVEIDELHTIKRVKAGEELTIDYREACDGAARGECDYVGR